MTTKVSDLTKGQKEVRLLYFTRSLARKIDWSLLDSNVLFSHAHSLCFSCIWEWISDYLNTVHLNIHWSCVLTLSYRTNLLWLSCCHCKTATILAHILYALGNSAPVYSVFLNHKPSFALSACGISWWFYKSPKHGLQDLFIFYVCVWSFLQVYALRISQLLQGCTADADIKMPSVENPEL